MGGSKMTDAMIQFKRRLYRGFLLLALCAASASGYGQQTHFNILAFYSTNVEKDHVMFAEQAMKFYSNLAKQDGFNFATTANWDDLNATRLKDVKIVLWLDDFPQKEEQRRAFEQY